jgi:hypothetical protein
MLFNRNKFKSSWAGYNDPVTAIFVGVSAFSAVQQHSAGKKAAASAGEQAAAQRESIAAQGRSASVEAQRQRVAQVREARIRRAQILSSAGNTGLGVGSSAVVGATSSVSSQAGANIGSIGQHQTFASEASAASQRAADAGARVAQAGAKAQQWQAIGSIAGSIFQTQGGFTSLAGGNTHSPTIPAGYDKGII